MESLTRTAGTMSEGMVFVMTALLLADELDQKKREAAKLRDEGREASLKREVALADTIMAEDLLRQGKLVAPFAARHAYPAGYYLQQRRSVGNKAGASVFQDWLLAEVAEHKRAMHIE